MTAAADVVASYLAAQEIPSARLGNDVFVLQLAGERKLSIPVSLFLGERSLVVESFFVRAPFERHAEVYAFLLRRNARARAVHFALAGGGDVYLVGSTPLARLDEEALDALLGEILTTADEMFDATVALGFGTYLEGDLAWRAKQQGGPPAG